MPLSPKGFVLAVVSAALFASRLAAADPVGGARTGPTEAPPKFFQVLVADLPSAKFHRNSSETKWQAGTVCRSKEDRGTAACRLLVRAWVVSVVADEKRGESSVVQELWLFEFRSNGDAQKAVRSFADEFDFGPFAKHPFTPFVIDRYAVVTEGRFRWHTDGERLDAYIKAAVAKAKPSE